jgi:cholestenol delta-isomerase
MDPRFVGLCGALPPLRKQYEELDSRYRNKDPTVMLVSGVELFLMGPLCLLLVYAILKKKHYRHPLQILVCTLQLMGTIMFAGTEIYTGCHNIPTDFGLTFTPDKLFYFWLLFVVANLVWIVVPLGLIRSSFVALKPLLEGKSHQA